MAGEEADGESDWRERGQRVRVIDGGGATTCATKPDLIGDEGNKGFFFLGGGVLKQIAAKCYTK